MCLPCDTLVSHVLPFVLCETCKQFLAGLKRLVLGGKLKLAGPWARLKDLRELQAWLDKLTTTDWNVFIEGPPHGHSRPRHVLGYLARYLTGGPIADYRIIRDIFER